MNEPKLRQFKHVRLARSPIAGWGLFAKRAFLPGDTIYTYKQVFMRSIPFRFVWIGNRRLTFGKQHMAKVDGRWEFTGMDSFVNHSSQPNAEYHTTSGGVETLRAKRTIRRGEELTVDYKSFHDESK